MSASKIIFAFLCCLVCLQVILAEEECAPTTCEAIGRKCGCVDDGCEGIICCGSCAPGSLCNEVVGLCESPKNKLPKARNVRGSLRRAAMEDDTGNDDEVDPKDPWGRDSRKLAASKNVNAHADATVDINESVDIDGFANALANANVGDEKPLAKARSVRGAHKMDTEDDDQIEAINDPWISSSLAAQAARNVAPELLEEKPLTKARNVRGAHKMDTGDDDQIEATNDPWIGASSAQAVRSEGSDKTVMDHNTYSQQKHEHEQSRLGRTGRGMLKQQAYASRKPQPESEPVVEAQTIMDHNTYSQQKHAHENAREGKTARQQREQQQAHAARSAALLLEETEPRTVMTHEIYSQQKHEHETSREGRAARGMKKQALQMAELKANKEASGFDFASVVKYGLPVAGLFGIALAAALFIQKKRHESKLGTYQNINNYATNINTNRRPSKHTINIAPSPLLTAQQQQQQQQPATPVPSNPANFEHRFKQTPKLKLRTSQNMTAPKSSPPDLKLSQTFTL